MAAVFLVLLLGWHFCRTKLARNIYFEARIFARRCFEIFPEMFEPLFCGSEKILQNSREISCKISLPEIKKKSPTSFCRSAGRSFYLHFGHQSMGSVRTLFFGYSPPPATHPPPPPTPLPGSRFRVVFWSFSSRFRVDFESRLESSRKTTRNRLSGRGVGGGGG